ncbi:MAG: D-2-hydroxyacid dehydrogenase [Verrucomicrobiota bacterium JB024]|nr:D-2-hydroxyacid dehydrogenase [Verrucomicrobiota bacterium JB024]
MKPNITILDAETFHFSGRSSWSILEPYGELTLYDRTGHDRAQIVERCREAQVVLTNKVPLDAETLRMLPELKLISVLATGYNIIDVQAARRQGVTVCNVPSYSTTSVAQHAVALILEMCNRVGDHAVGVRAGEWVRSPVFSYWLSPPRELAGMTVGLVGLGEIGRAVAERLRPFGVRLLAYTPSRRGGFDWPEFAWANSVEEVFESADLVSLHCPQTPANTGFVNAALLGRMRPGSMLVNTARGGLIKEHDLAAALREGPLAAAAVDVVGVEPMCADNPLLALENCYITPHLAWASEESRQRLLGITRDNLQSFFGGTPQHVVNA